MIRLFIVTFFLISHNLNIVFHTASEPFKRERKLISFLIGEVFLYESCIVFTSFLQDKLMMNLSSDQAAQGAQYAGRAMNVFQTAVNIDNQQPKTEGTTFWFRWLIRIVAVVTGICK